jgi:hypothetical protein
MCGLVVVTMLRFGNGARRHVKMFFGVEFLGIMNIKEFKHEVRASEQICRNLRITIILNESGYSLILVVLLKHFSR